MRKSLRVDDYVAHILDAIDPIERYTFEHDDFTFENDTQVQDAFIRNIEVIGEASNSIKRADPNFVQAHKHIPWALLYEMRNKVSHGYFSIDLDVVWRTIQNDLPILKRQIHAILEQ